MWASPRSDTAPAVSPLRRQFSDYVFIYGVFALYAALTLFIVFHHEPWRDEAEPWLIAQNLSIPGIFHMLNYEGTPVLWYMLLHFLALLRLPFFSEQVLNWAIASAAVFIFLKYAPFSRLLKFAFAFSYLMSYEYAVIARNYSISVLLLFAIAAVYGSRFKKPLIFATLVFLLFNTNVHSFVPAAMLLFIFVYELFGRVRPSGGEIKYYAAIVIMVLGALVCVWSLWPAPDNAQSGLGGVPNLAYIPLILKGPFFPYVQHITIKPVQPLLVPVSILILLSGIFALGRRILLINFLAGYVWLWYIFIVKQHGYFGPMHQGLILVLLLFNLWLGIYYGAAQEKEPVIRKAALFLITASLLSTFLVAYHFDVLDYKLPFSEGKQMAEFIKESGANGYTIIADRQGACLTPLAFLPRDTRFWYAATEKYGSFIVNHSYSYPSNKQLLSEISYYFPGKRDYLLLLSYPLSLPYSEDYVLIKSYTHAYGLGREDYFLYAPIPN